MTFDWEPHKETIYRLYVEEKKSLKQAAEILKTQYNFAPSIRSLHHQAKRWNLPIKGNKVHDDEQLVARIRQLWETNHTAKDMLRTLNEEGFQCTETDLNRVRRKNDLLLRLDRPTKLRKSQAALKSSQQPQHQEGGGDHGPGPYDIHGQDSHHTSIALGYENSYDASDLTTVGNYLETNEDVNEQRRRQLAAEAEEKRLTKKRRRWTIPHSGLPADPPGPPRFPSEMTLTECRNMLSMDKPVYMDVRAKFQRLCEVQNIIKKTIAGPEKWEAAKHELVRETMHLRGVFWDDANIVMKKLALDLICCDVTKTMRANPKKMSLATARTLLGLNPEMAREVRQAMHILMREVQFVTKRLMGDEGWVALKQRWIDGTPIIQNIVSQLSPADPQYGQKTKAIEWLARDAMRRWSDWNRRGIDPLARLNLPPSDDEDDGDHGDDAHQNTGTRGNELNVPDFTQPDHSGFQHVDEADDVLITQQLSVQPANGQVQGDNENQTKYQNQAQNQIQTQIQHPTDPAEPPAKRRPGRPRKPRDENGKITSGPVASTITVQPQPTPPRPKKRGRPLGSGRKQTEKRNNYLPGRLVWGPNNEPRFVLDEVDQASGPAPAPTPTPAPPPALSSTPSQTTTPSNGPDRPQMSNATPTPVSTYTPSITPAQAPHQTLSQAPPPAPAAPPSTGTIAVYFRIHPSTTVPYRLQMWITTMTVRSVDEVRTKAVARHPEAVCARIEGIVKDGSGGEIPLPVPGNEELTAYLDHVREVGGAPTFSVQLVHAWEAGR